MILKQTQFEEMISHEITDEQYHHYLNMRLKNIFNDTVKRCEGYKRERDTEMKELLTELNTAQVAKVFFRRNTKVVYEN